MTVDVLIERDKLGRLHGYVLQQRGDGVIEKGDDMLKKRVFRDVSMAKLECDRIIREFFKEPIVTLDRITYTFPEDYRP